MSIWQRPSALQVGLAALLVLVPFALAAVMPSHDAELAGSYRPVSWYECDDSLGWSPPRHYECDDALGWSPPGQALPDTDEGFDADSAHDLLVVFRRQTRSTNTRQLDWATMTNEQRLAHLESLALSSGEALRLSAKFGLAALTPIVGEDYVDSLAGQMSDTPQRLIDAAPGKYIDACRAVQRMGGNVEGFDRGMHHFGEKLLHALDVASDPDFITHSLD